MQTKIESKAEDRYRLRRIGMNAKLITGILLAGLAVVFLLQNITVIDMRFLFWKLSMSRAIWMVMILMAGILLGWLLRGSFNRRKSRGHDDQRTEQVTHSIGE
jgi:uncharacterized integral membrane protein